MVISLIDGHQSSKTHTEGLDALSHRTTGAWAVPKLHGIYFSVFPLSSYFEIEVCNND
jgi:hypothetical protein